MIDAGEPKDGDYVRYLDALTNASTSQAAEGLAPGRAAEAAARRSARRARAAGTAPGHVQPPPAQPAKTTGGRPKAEQARQLQETLDARLNQLRNALPDASGSGPAHFVRQAGRFAFIAGIALIVLSFTDHAPFFADPVTGLVLIASSAFLKRLARTLS